MTGVGGFHLVGYRTGPFDATWGMRKEVVDPETVSHDPGASSLLDFTHVRR